MGKRNKVDPFDLAILAGFVALVAGIWLMSPAWALVIGGLFLLAFGLYGSWVKGAEKARKKEAERG